MAKLCISDLNLKNKKVIMRVDFNVPLNEDLSILDDTRIKLTLPTIEYILKQNASLILISHLGRPKGNKNIKFSLKPCAKRLEQLINKKIIMADDCIGESVQTLVKNLQAQDILMLENLRFHDAEEHPDNDPTFAKKLASFADVYINDAFGTAHRRHSSTVDLTYYFPEQSAMGFLMEKEVNFLSKTIQNPQKPFFALIGGAKISSKIGVLNSLLNKADALYIGGGMAFTFLKAKGLDIGDSLFDENMLDFAKTFLQLAKKNNKIIHLPEDIVIADAFSNDAAFKVIKTSSGIPPHWQGMDLGNKTIHNWSQDFQKCKTLFWNGPLGVFEFNHFSHGTFEMAKKISHLDAITIVGGGDSLAAINKLNLGNSFTHLSTGGGACLEFIEHGHLPGIDALSERKN